MKAVRIIVFIVGMLLLVAGVHFQDGVARGGLIALNVMAASRGAPAWDDLNHGYELVQAQAQTGLVLKLTGLAILFSLFFLTLRRKGRQKSSNTFLPALLGLGSGVCFAVYTVLAPLATILSWALTKAVATRLPSGLDTRGLSELLNARYAEGILSVTGVIVLAAGLFLLAAALFTYRRGSRKAIFISLTAPSLFFFLAQGREAIEVSHRLSWLDVAAKKSVFFYTGIIFPIVAIAIFIRGLMVRKKDPGKTRSLTVALLVISGCLAVTFWVTSLYRIGAMHSFELQAAYRPTPSDIAGYASPLVGCGVLLYVCLVLCAVFVPILCAFSLKRLPEQTTETGPVRKPVFPLIAGGLTLIAFATAAFFGLHENRFKAALRSVGYYGHRFLIEPEKDKPREVQAAMGVFESEEGLQFLRETMNNPREYYWHEFVARYMWQCVRNPKSKELFFDMLLDESHPIASTWAANTILNAFAFHMYPGAREMSEDSFLSYLSHRPELGGRFFEIVTEGAIFRSSLVYEILKTCSEAGVEKLSFHAKTGARPGEILGLPEGFTVYLPQKAPKNRSIFSIKLSWSETERYEGSYHPHSKTRSGRVELDADGKKVGYITDQYGTKIPDYQELSEVIKKAKDASSSRSDSGAFLVEVRIDPIVPSYHIMRVLNSCAKAGLTEVSIAEP